MKQKLVMLTAYDFPSAQLVDEVGVDYLLVGDSLAMTILGYPDTRSITMDEMLHHVKAVVRGAPQSKIIADMPVNSYKTSIQALANAKRFMKAGVYGVKIEGNPKEVIKILIANNITVMGHLGLLPQTAEKYRIHGKKPAEAQQIIYDAQLLDALGVIAIVLECVPENLAKQISDDIVTPTIGIGAGVYCDGQVLVTADIIGLSGFSGRMVKQYADVRSVIKQALQAFKRDVQNNTFPAKEHSFS